MKLRFVVLMTLVVALVGVLALPVAAQDAAPKLVIWADDTRAEPLRAIGEKFTAEQGIEIEVVELPFDEIRDQITTAAPAGEGADIIVGANDWVGELVVSGLLEPLDLGDKQGDFLESALGAFTYEGTLYGMPYAVENIAFFRNTDLVPEAPATWAEVREISQMLVDEGKSTYGYVIQENDPYHFFPLMTAHGGYIFGLNEDGSYNVEDVGIDSEGSVAALTWVEEQASSGLMPGGLEYDSMHTLFETGEAAMIVTGPWALERINASEVPYAISAIPGADAMENGFPFIGVQGFMLSAFSENKALASLFLTNYIATDEVMMDIFEAGRRPSAFVPVREMVDDADLAAFGEAGAEGQPIPSIPQMGAVFTIWGNAIELVVQGKADAATSFTDAAPQIREAVGAESE